MVQNIPVDQTEQICNETATLGKSGYVDFTSEHSPERSSWSVHYLGDFASRPGPDSIISSYHLVSYLASQTVKYKAELLQAQSVLARLVRANATHTTAYFKEQWERQREIQLRAISVRVQEKRDRLKVMMELEENMIEAR